MTEYKHIVNFGDWNKDVSDRKRVLPVQAPLAVRDVLILGGGSAGWIAALTLAHKNPSLRIRLLRSSEIGIIGVGEGTTAAFTRHFFQYLGLDMKAFYQAVAPSWKLGVKFLWGGDRPFYYAFGSDFEKPVPQLKKPSGYYAGPGSRWIGPASALMANDRVFGRKADGSPDLSQSHAFHIENESLVGWLEATGRQVGIEVIDGIVSQVPTVGVNLAGSIEPGVTSLVLEDGRVLNADLYVDASGFRGEILHRALGVERRGYSDSLFCDRALIGGWPRAGEPVLPYTVAEAMDAGWSWQIEHREWINRGYVYASRFKDDDQAEVEFRKRNPRLGDLRRVKFESYRLDRMWAGNAVAIGNASGFVEPLEATALQAICVQSSTLADCLADSSCIPTRSLVDYYNRYNTKQWDDIRDFLAVHYRYNHAVSSPFWEHCREETTLGGAEAVVGYYRENGPSTLLSGIVLEPTNSFGLEGYYSMLIGQGEGHDRRYHPEGEDQQAWRRYHDSLGAMARAALTCEQATEAFRRAGWLPAA